VRAAVVSATHGFDIVHAPDPTPGPDELVLRVEACGICGSDLKAVDRMPVGLVMGHEFCGSIVAAGWEVADAWPIGAAATALPLIGCGVCLACLSGDVAHCGSVDAIGVGGSSGGYAEFVRVSARETHALPAGLPAGAGALVEPLSVGLNAVERAALRPGDSVLVVGAGPVGLAVIVWARLLGAGEIVVAEPVRDRREAAGRFGATGAVDPDTESIGGPYDVVFECVGVPGMINTCVAAAAVHGRVVIVGVCTKPDPFIPVVAVVKELTMLFTVYYQRRHFAHTIAVLGDGRINPDLFITDRVDLDGFPAAFAALKSPSTQRKVLVQP
jgi:(R,R)-butanediol dehydrogenase / meso-butanediol dehydrogenase / diacetyl reductase